MTLVVLFFFRAPAQSYTKTVPLFVQTVRQSTVRQVAPFLDPGQDVIVSMEQTRFRLLALSAVCPGASTLVGNLLRSADVRPPGARAPTLAGRRWLREYVNGCAYSIVEVPVLKHLEGRPFIEAAEWLYRAAGCVLLGVVGGAGDRDAVRLNPGAEPLTLGTTLLVLGTSKKGVIRAMKAPYSPPPDRTLERALEALAAAAPPEWDPLDDGDGACQPVHWGAPDSDSVDSDTVPCVGPEAAAALRTREDVRAYVERSLDGAAGGGGGGEGGELSGHFILCGHRGSVVPFLEYLRAAQPSPAPTIVILSPEPPADLAAAAARFGPVVHVRGSPAEAACLRAAGAARAQALVFLARGSRPVKSAQATGAAVELARSTREAVLADADALLAVYGVGEESGAALTHAVVELLFTTSIEFLQPGLLLRGVSAALYGDEAGAPAGAPRKSWAMRAWQQREAVAEGLAEWVANPYYAAGRVTVPALMDAFATQCFFNRGLLVGVLAQLAGADLGGGGGDGGATLEGPVGGALLQQVPLPPGLAGRTYGECVMALAAGRGQVALGLYRRKSENPGTRLSVVVANPAWHETVEASDRVFVLRAR
jgi:hypothetical protein